MSQSNLTIDEVMLRIKEAMRAEKMKMNQYEIENNSVPVDQNNTQNKLNELDLELRNNNLRWNIMTEWLITSHRKTIGRFIVLGKKAVRKFLRWYINPPIDQQREFNGSVTRSLNITGDLLHSYAEEIEHNRVNMLELTEQVKALQKEHMALIEQFKAVQTENMKLESDIQTNINSLFAESTITNDRLRRIERKINEGLNLDPQTPTIDKIVADDKTDNLDFDYFLFEQRFRGSREEIKQRQQVYLQYFTGKSNVLDFGCGRGEFVELMIENGVNVIGVDLNTDMVAYCQDRGLPVIKADGLEYLENIENNSLDGIFSAMVIEHLEQDSLLKLIHFSYTKLKPGGVLLLETINPQTLVVFASQFYVDLTHQKPIHPLTLNFLFEIEGFSKIEYVYSSPAEHMKIPLIYIHDLNSSNNIEAFNNAINNLNNIMFGNQDYAIVGTK